MPPRIRTVHRRPDRPQKAVGRPLAWVLGLLLGWGGAPPAAQADSGSVTVTAAVLSRNQCSFRTNSASLAFGSIDPGGSATASAQATVTLRCNGASRQATYIVQANSGLYGSAELGLRMRHATLTTQYLGYTLSVAPVSATVARNTDTAITVTATVLPAQYASAAAGAYADQVTLTVTP